MDLEGIMWSEISDTEKENTDLYVKSKPNPPPQNYSYRDQNGLVIVRGECMGMTEMGQKAQTSSYK